MSNNSVKESENNFGATNEMSNADFKGIGNIEVKVKPTNFEDIEGKIASVYYIDQVMDKLVYDLNNKFVSNLNTSIVANAQNIVETREEFLSISQALAQKLDNLNELIHNSHNYITPTGEVEDLRSGVIEILETAIINNNEIHWEEPTHSDIL